MFYIKPSLYTSLDKDLLSCPVALYIYEKSPNKCRELEDMVGELKNLMMVLDHLEQVGQGGSVQRNPDFCTLGFTGSCLSTLSYEMLFNTSLDTLQNILSSKHDDTLLCMMDLCDEDEEVNESDDWVRAIEVSSEREHLHSVLCLINNLSSK